MGDRLWAGEPSRFVTGHLNSAFHPSGVGKLSTGLWAAVNPLLPNGGASEAPPLCFSQISFFAFGILLRAFMYS